MNNVVVTGFDGVITKKNTFNEFVKFTKGKRKYHIGKLLLSPYHIASNMGICKEETVMEKEFSYFFKKMDYEQLKQKSEEYAEHIDKNITEEKLAEIKNRGRESEEIYVVSGNIKEIIKPWCDKNGMKILDSTTVELSKNGHLTGRLNHENRLKEKIDNILNTESEYGNQKISIFGHSSKDKELLTIADQLLAC